MKTLQIKVTAIFEADGKITPVKFRVDDIDVRVQKVLKIYEEKAFGNRYAVFICMHNSKDTYELKYDMDTFLWYLIRR